MKEPIKMDKTGKTCNKKGHHRYIRVKKQLVCTVCGRSMDYLGK